MHSWTTSTITLAERTRFHPTKPVNDNRAAGSTRAKNTVYDRYEYCPRKDIPRVTHRPPLQSPQSGKAFVIVRREPGEDRIPRYLVRQVVELPQPQPALLNGGTAATAAPSDTRSTAAPSRSPSPSSASSSTEISSAESVCSGDGGGGGKLASQKYVGPLFRVCLHDVHRWVPLRAVEAFENRRFQHNEPDYSSKKAWMRAKRRAQKQDAANSAAAAAAVASAPPAFVKSPHVEVVVYNPKRARPVYYDDITDLPEPKKARSGRPRKEEVREAEARASSSSPSVADSNPLESPRSHRYGMVARALAPETVDQETSAEDEEEWEVDRIVEHKDVDGVRHYAVAWVGAEETTWLTAEDLGGAEDSLLEYLRGLAPDERLEEEQMMLDLPDFDIDAGDLDVGSVGLANSQIGEGEIVVDDGSDGPVKFKRFKDIS